MRGYGGVYGSVGRVRGYGGVYGSAGGVWDAEVRPCDCADGKDLPFASPQHHRPGPRTGTEPGGMENKPASNPAKPRELTQNPLKKIWMPYKNGLPEKHTSQRKGWCGNVALFADGFDGNLPAGLFID